MKDHFGNFIGQVKVKKALNFHISSYHKSKIFHPILFASPRGSGKTEMCRQICASLLKPHVEINGSSINNVGSFVDNVVVPHIVGNQEISIFIDEIHASNKNFLNWMLSVIAPNKENRTTAAHDGNIYTFDFRHVAFIFATTNAEKLGIAFNERPRRYEFAPYSLKELAAILKLNCPGLKFKGGVENEIVMVGRESPREVVRIAGYIKEYLDGASWNQDFGYPEWKELSDILSIQPLGLKNNEISLLKRLNSQHKPQSLRALSSALSLDSCTIQRDVEPFLIKHSLIGIDGKRFLTNKGQKILEQIRE